MVSFTYSGKTFTVVDGQDSITRYKEGVDFRLVEEGGRLEEGLIVKRTDRRVPTGLPRQAWNEIRFLRRASFPGSAHVVAFKAAWVDDEFFYLVMERAKIDLCEYLFAKDKPMPVSERRDRRSVVGRGRAAPLSVLSCNDHPPWLQEEELRVIIRHVLKGLFYLKSEHSCAHGDLSLENVMLKRKASVDEPDTWMLIDLGHSGIVGEDPTLWGVWKNKGSYTTPEDALNGRWVDW